MKSYYLTMDKNADEVLEQALALPIGDRAALADSLLDSLETSADHDAGERWRAEIEKRISDLDSGRVQTVPWADVEARLRSRIG